MTFESTTTESQVENLEDLYELSPMQQGMLFHSIYAPNSGAYFEQSLFTIRGELDLAAFKGAWQRVIVRHPILRTAFLWEDLEKPVQVVYRQIDLPLAEHDWRSFSEAERERQLESFIVADRGRDFFLSRAPLIRLALLRLTDNEYKFLFSRHHLLLDRWSRALLLKDLFAHYDALSQGKDLNVDVPRPYGEFITWLKRQDAIAAENFWKASLEGFTQPTPFGLERKIDQASCEGERYVNRRVQLTEVATKKLGDFARQHRLTLNTLVQGAWSLLLSRYGGENDIVFGVTVAGRSATLSGVEEMVGLFINTLPLRVRVPQHTPVLSWLKDLQARQSEMQQYEYSSLLDIQGWSEVPRGVPLFESILVFENLPVGSSHQATSTSVEFRDDRGIGSATGYPLTVLVSPGQKLGVQIVYDRGLYHDEAIDSLLIHFQTLLENLPANVETAVSRLPLLTDSERERILVQWNNTSVESSPLSIQERFEAQVERTPDNAAVMFGDQELSYRELNRRANQLAHHLRRLNIGADAKVGICIDRGVEMVIGVLATVKAGGAYVPLDPEYPRQRLQFMLNDAHCSVLLTNERILSSLPEIETKLLCLDRDWEQVAVERDDNPGSENGSENLLYVMYTSGSTGEPKGVAMTHGALANLLSWQLEHAGTFTAARTLQFASLSFDVSFQEMFSTWCSGGTLLLVSDEMRREVLSLLRFLLERRVERIFVPFVFLHHLAEAVELGGTPPLHLREIMTAGEQLEITPQIAKLCDQLTGCTLHNHYGPSETHVVTAYSLTGQASNWSQLPPIGRPITNTRIHILDENLEPTPIGVPGQLCIGGASLSRGYLNRPGLTAEKFLPDPFDNEAGARLYLTGDLARYENNGVIEFLGRLDNQVKIRGFRVELGEIEAMLAGHPSVREVAVVAREDVRGERKLVCYVVAAINVTNDLSSELRSYLKDRLPDHMIPTAFVTMTELPLTPSGKVDRRALPPPDQAISAAINQYEAPRKPVEEKLAEIWAAVLRRERVGMTDNFFELGGHSLLATQLISRVRNAFHVELQLRTLFESPTIAELASVIDRLETKVEDSVAGTINRERKEGTDYLLNKIDQLSDEDVDLLLRGVLTETGDTE